MKTNRRSNHQQAGFTLVELMVTLVVAFLVIAAVYASFKVQQQNEKAQQQVTQIQQNLRAAIDMMSRDFVVAGYDPSVTGDYGPITNYSFDGKIFYTSSTSFTFTGDLCEETDFPNNPNDPDDNCQSSSPYSGQKIRETYLYEHHDSDGDGIDDALTIYLHYDSDGDGIDDQLDRLAIANNIDRIEFNYLLDDGTYTLAPAAAQLNNIAAVRVTILARADQPDYRYTDNNTYSTGFTDMDGTDIAGTDWDPSTFAYSNNLNYRRRMLAKTIYLRNMGL
jgi:type IV pilus assembly protein PilW